MKRSAGSDDVPAPSGWWSSPFSLTFAGGMLLWLSFQPLGLSWIAWLAPLPWLKLIRQPHLTGRWSYFQIWLAATIAWLALLEGIRRAHPANHLGWLALSCYVGAYQPAFIALTRSAVRLLKIPLWLAAPVVWVAGEVVRSYLFTGFSVGLLGHALSDWTRAIQIADVAGAFAVSFLIMLIASCVASLRNRDTGRWQYRPAWIAGLILGGVYAYGLERMATAPQADSEPSLKVALLQGTRDKIFELNPELDQRAWAQYDRLMRHAAQSSAQLDVIVWPEASFTGGQESELLMEGSPSAPPGSQLSDSEFHNRVEDLSREFAKKLARAADAINRRGTDVGSQPGSTYLLLGADTIVFRPGAMDLYNTALLVDSRGLIADRYYKTHPVMFGEYLPFGEVWPWLYSLTPMRQGLSRGTGPRSFAVKGFRLAPSICFEITVPQLIREHVNRLERETGAAPDVLVNLTDDGWFWGSTVLDLQLACGVFRAIEMRRPLLVAANTGISAAIDGNGQVLRRAPKRQEETVFANVVRDSRSTLYRRWGDLPAMLCLACTVAWGAMVAHRKRVSRGKA